MSQRSVWKGSIRIGLLDIPVKLYLATKEDNVSFKNLCDKCFTPINMRRYCPKCNEEVAYNNLKKGYALSKDNIIVIDKEDIDRLKLKSEKVIDIIGFVRHSDIDLTYFNSMKYYALPNLEVSDNLKYVIAHRILSLKGLIGLGKLTIRNRERLVGVRTFNGILEIVGLHYQNEIMPIPTEEIPNAEISNDYMDLATQLFDKKNIGFDVVLKEKDRYTESLKELVKAKAQNKPFSLVEEIAKPQAKELLDILKDSVKEEEKKVAIEVKGKEKK